jgi:signal transduction histidine kinase
LGILLALGILGVLYWLRVRGFAVRERALERGISERTAALQAEIGVRKETESALQKSNEELGALNRMAQSLTEWADLSRALEGVGVTLSSLLGEAGVSIWALDDQRRLLTRLLAVSGGRLVKGDREVSLEGDPVTCDVLDDLQFRVLEAGSPLPLIAGPPNTEGERAGEVMLVPLQSRGDSVGIMCIRAATPEQRFTRENTVLAQTIAGTVANALENARLVAAERAAVAEEERARIARELHDSVSQSLYAANLTAEVLPSLWEANPQRGREATAAVRQFTQSAMAQMRSLLVELRPTALVNTSLSDLLETLKVAFPLSYTLQVDTVVAHAPIFSPEVQIALYRIAQEALNNIIKHANAQHARINLSLTPPYVEQTGSELWHGMLVLKISDDGQGYDPAHRLEGRLGVDGMRERAASIGAVLKITSSPGEGTEIEVRWAGSARKVEKAPQ